MSDLDVGEILEETQAEDPTIPGEDVDDDFADIYDDPGEVLDLDKVDLSG